MMYETTEYLGVVFHILLLSLGLNMMVHMSPLFVSIMSVVARIKLGAATHVYTKDDAIVIGASICPWFTKLMTCIWCTSLWSTLVMSAVLLITFTNLDAVSIFLVCITCSLVAPMVNYIILRLLESI